MQQQHEWQLCVQTQLCVLQVSMFHRSKSVIKPKWKTGAELTSSKTVPMETQGVVGALKVAAAPTHYACLEP